MIGEVIEGGVCGLGGVVGFHETLERLTTVLYGQANLRRSSGRLRLSFVLLPDFDGRRVQHDAATDAMGLHAVVDDFLDPRPLKVPRRRCVVDTVGHVETDDTPATRPGLRELEAYGCVRLSAEQFRRRQRRAWEIAGYRFRYILECFHAILEQDMITEELGAEVFVAGSCLSQEEEESEECNGQIHDHKPFRKSALTTQTQKSMTERYKS